jgi:hypothetical protein
MYGAGRKRWLGRAAFAAALLLLPALALACPSCKDAFTENPEGLGFAKGVYYSILVFFTVFFGSVGFFIYKLVQAAKREEEPPAPASSPQA